MNRDLVFQWLNCILVCNVWNRTQRFFLVILFQTVKSLSEVCNSRSVLLFTLNQPCQCQCPAAQSSLTPCRQPHARCAWRRLCRNRGGGGGGGGGVDQVGEGRGRNCGTRDPGREMRTYINTQPSPIVFVPNMLLHLRTLSKNRTNGPIVTRVLKPVTVWRLPEVL